MSKKKPLKVKHWIYNGELDISNLKQDDILNECGRILDKSCAPEIFGDVLFQATDGKYYTITVEAVLGKANPKWVKEGLAEHAEDIKKNKIMTKKLSAKLQALILMGAKTVGYKDAYTFIEEQLTILEADSVEGFLNWVNASPSTRGFGHGNIDARYDEYINTL